MFLSTQTTPLSSLKPCSLKKGSSHGPNQRTLFLHAAESRLLPLPPHIFLAQWAVQSADQDGVLGWGTTGLRIPFDEGLGGNKLEVMIFGSNWAYCIPTVYSVHCQKLPKLHTAPPPRFTPPKKKKEKKLAMKCHIY